MNTLAVSLNSSITGTPNVFLSADKGFQNESLLNRVDNYERDLMKLEQSEMFNKSKINELENSNSFLKQEILDKDQE